MLKTIAIVVVIFALAALFAWLSRRLQGKEKLPYEKKPAVLTKAEMRFFQVLLQATSGEPWWVFPKVGQKDVVGVIRGTQNYMSYFARLSQKHFDFILCDKGSTAPILAIELDDSSHDRADRMERDSFVNRACDAAGLPVLHQKVTKTYDPVALRREIHTCIAAQAAAAQRPAA